MQIVTTDTLLPYYQRATEDYDYFGTHYTDVLVNNSGTHNLGLAWQSRRELYSNPDWKIKVSKKQDASLPYFRREIDAESGSYVHKSERRYIFYPHMTLYGSDTRVFYPEKTITDMSYEDAAIADIAVQRLKRKLNNRTQSANLIIPIAELRELRQTVVGATEATYKVLMGIAEVKKTLKRSIVALKSPKKLRKALRNAYKDASDMWLTYSFGISPMMSTILDINKSISAYLTRYDSIDRLTGSAKKAWTKQTISDSQTSENGSVCKMIIDESFEIAYKFTAGHKFNLASANDYGALDHFGIKPPSLVPALWELTAFSWVIDYFTTAGAFLDDTFTGTTGNSIYVVKNRKFTYKNSTRPHLYKSNPNGVYYLFNTSTARPALMDAYEFQRVVLDSYPPRVLRFKTLDEMGLNGVSKLLNLASVLSKSI